MSSFMTLARARGFTRLMAIMFAVILVGACASEPDIVQQTFATPEEAAEALVSAAETFDVEAMKAILGPDGASLVVTEDPVQDRNQATAFAAQARENMDVSIRPDDLQVAEMSVGTGEWPLPIPLVQDGDRWRFDAAAGREEILLRRIGSNELDAIQACRNYVEAQLEYASERRDGSAINQYAQRVISSPGKRDGLAWQEDDGSWGGPVGEGTARAIAQGYSERSEPYRGYYFKILKGQGPNAPMGELNFLVKDVMIGGFALVAAPAEYDVTGVMTFIVSHAGIVFERDFGPETLERVRDMELYDPGPGWKPVQGF